MSGSPRGVGLAVHRTLALPLSSDTPKASEYSYINTLTTDYLCVRIGIDTVRTDTDEEQDND